MNELRQFISAGQCPWCEKKKHFINIAAHTFQAHGIYADELREMAGLNRSRSVCDPDYSEACRERVSRRPSDEIARCLAAGRTKEVQLRTNKTRSEGLRPEGRENFIKDRSRPERKEAFIQTINSPNVLLKRKIKAQNRRPEVVEAQTVRIQQAYTRWSLTVTPEERKESRKRAYQTWIRNTSQEHVDQHFNNMRKMIPHDAQVKGAAAAAKVIPVYHANPEWKARWRANMMAAYLKKAKVPRTEWPTIKQRFQNGETPQQIATDYKVTHNYISKILRKITQEASPHFLEDLETNHNWDYWMKYFQKRMETNEV